MLLKNIELTNFRNYTNQQVFFGDNLNVLIGKNAQGKTNLLEAIFLITIGKSPRTNKEKEMIKWESTFSKVTLEVLKHCGQTKIELFLFQNQTKAIKINNFSIKKISELIGELNALYFSPDELKIIKNGPDERRRFLDMSLSQINKLYFFNINKYNHIVMQRNKLLKSSKNILEVKETINIWDNEMAELGACIIMERFKFINNIKKHISAIYKEISGKADELTIEYNNYKNLTFSEVKKEIIKNLQLNLEKDSKLGYTSIGPHRDDLKFFLNNAEVKPFASQGEQRSVALALKLSEVEVFNELFGEYPVLLLDDVLSELDLDRQKKLLDKIKNIQTILTCTHFNFDIDCKKFKVEKGEILDNF